MEPHQRRGVVALLAGGTGTRMASETPKQLLEVGGRTLLEHALHTFHAHPRVHEIVLVMAADHLDAARALVDRGGYADKVTAVVPGGASRSDSTRAALAELGDAEVDLLVHDAARPLVTERIVDDCFAALATHAAVSVAVTSPDTIVEVDAHDRVLATPPRESLRRVQTPQAFRSEVLRLAHDRAAADPGFTATDDCSVVGTYCPDVPVVVVAGDERNLKVTTPLDLVVVEALLATGEGRRG
ncbi:2-C-methyl-D-erythritol 4-phosphate cytidylyltransferase [Nocardioides coralli]|uniref:2-C-methyl-D-erythritol 4-phosphate cytidylyltransferase n=1 Tax=Nocardioides coralli TaxID=2872154 RepID=UPI001CA3B506|nr:2-C-methyl-D-erythritol 4-phosphate cytidylyltransferase [Nocardioides coralli]QZY29415.1 2-C-methyl-D-erythritol 4-phosphate cytidylyltransferase [Nocardioides coralli]